MHEESNLKHQSIALGPSNGKVHPSLRGWWVLIVSCNTRITFHVLTYFIAYHNIGGCTGSRTPKKPNRSCGCCPPAECSQYFFWDSGNTNVHPLLQKLFSAPKHHLHQHHCCCYCLNYCHHHYRFQWCLPDYQMLQQKSMFQGRRRAPDDVLCPTEAGILQGSPTASLQRWPLGLDGS